MKRPAPDSVLFALSAAAAEPVAGGEVASDARVGARADVGLPVAVELMRMFDEEIQKMLEGQQTAEGGTGQPGVPGEPGERHRLHPIRIDAIGRS